jgi:hypothetical protein
MNSPLHIHHLSYSSPILLEHWVLSPIEGPLWIASCKIERSVSPMAHLYQWKENNIGQSIWDKSEVLLKTYWGTHWELIGNIVRTYWEPGKMEKSIKSSSPPPPPPSPPQKTLKEKKQGTLSACFGPSNWLHEISLPKRVHHHFWPGLIALANYLFNLYTWELNFGQTIG